MNTPDTPDTPEIRGDDYCVAYDASSMTITFEGALRLQGMAEYAPIGALLDAAAAACPPTITLDLRALKFLNSSGINTLSRFVIKMRKQGGTGLVVCGSHAYPWQEKSLRNLERLMPGLHLEIE